MTSGCSQPRLEVYASRINTAHLSPSKAPRQPERCEDAALEAVQPPHFCCKSVFCLQATLLRTQTCFWLCKTSHDTDTETVLVPSRKPWGYLFMLLFWCAALTKGKQLGHVVILCEVSECTCKYSNPLGKCRYLCSPETLCWGNSSQNTLLSFWKCSLCDGTILRPEGDLAFFLNCWAIMYNRRIWLA